MLLPNMKHLLPASVVFVIYILVVTAEKEPIEEDGVTPRTAQKFEDVFKTDVHSSTSTPGTNLGFTHAFIASLSVIVVSELGDKTFFIAAIMAMRHPRITVFIGAITALALMTVLSVAFGMAATIIPRAWTYYGSTLLFIIFGLKMLREGYKMSPTEAQEELEEVQSDLKKRDDELMAKEKGSPLRSKNFGHQDHVEEDVSFCVSSSTGDHLDSIQSKPSPPVLTADSHVRKSHTNGNLVIGESDAITIVRVNSASATLHVANDGVVALPKFEKEALTGDIESGRSYHAQTISLLSRVLIQAFTLTFLAEWGDRSQLTTIILAAREDVYGVTLGGVLGHSFCTGLAVIGGRFIAQRISVRTVTITGGVVFLVFALTALLFDPSDS